MKPYRVHGLMPKYSTFPSVFVEIEIINEGCFLVILREKNNKVNVLNITDSDFESSCSDCHQDTIVELDSEINKLLEDCSTIKEALEKLRKCSV